VVGDLRVRRLRAKGGHVREGMEGLKGFEKGRRGWEGGGKGGRGRPGEAGMQVRLRAKASGSLRVGLAEVGKPLKEHPSSAAICPFQNGTLAPAMGPRKFEIESAH
jgi:hypothetical protein